MFTDKTLKEASILAKDITDRGISLRAKADTPLYSLCSESMPPIELFKDNKTIFRKLKKLTAIKRQDGVEAHSSLLNDLARGLGESLLSIMSIARNDVNPMVKECLERIEDYVENKSKRNVGISIIPVFQLEILKNGTLDALIEKYTEVELQPVSWETNSWPFFDITFLKESAKNKSKEIDTQVDKLLEETEDDVISAIYDHSFRNRNIPEEVVVYNDSLIDILTFLWCSAWLVKLPEGVNSNLKELTLNLTNLKSNSARRLNNTMKAFDRKVSQNNFMLQMPNEVMAKNQFIVQGEIYNKWLTDGGSPEILIGAFLSDDLSSITNLTEDKVKEFMRHYNLDVNIRKQEFDSKKAVMVTEATSDYIDVEIENMKADRTLVRERFNVKVKKYPYKETMDLPRWVRKVLCVSFFPNSSALEALEEIDLILTDRPNADPREAATSVAISLIANWINDNIEVSRTNQ